MVKVNVHTNLDLFNESWPKELPDRPVVGDYITSKTEHPQYAKNMDGTSKGGMPTHYFSLELEVVAVRWKPDKFDVYYLDVELHSKKVYSIDAFFDWYAPLVNKRKSYFI